MSGTLSLSGSAEDEDDHPADESPPTPSTEGTTTPDSSGEVTVVTGLVHATGSSPDEATELKLDLYLAAGSEDAPMVVDVGGAVHPRALAVRGVSVISADYPDQWSKFMLDADPTAVRTMVEAVACAVRFARGSEYGSETAPLVLTGFSGDAIAASHVALAGESFDRVWGEYAESAGGPPAQYDCTASEASTRVDGFVGIGGGYAALVGYESEEGPYDREFLLEHEPDLWELLHGSIGLHPELRVRLLHGDADWMIPYEQSAEFEAVLAEAGYDVELVEFAGGHTIPHGDLLVETVMELVE
jgi:hypothetical protein